MKQKVRLPFLHISCMKSQNKEMDRKSFSHWTSLKHSVLKKHKQNWTGKAQIPPLITSRLSFFSFSKRVAISSWEASSSSLSSCSLFILSIRASSSLKESAICKDTMTFCKIRRYMTCVIFRFHAWQQTSSKPDSSSKHKNSSQNAFCHIHHRQTAFTQQEDRSWEVLMWPAALIYCSGINSEEVVFECGNHSHSYSTTQTAQENPSVCPTSLIHNFSYWGNYIQPIGNGKYASEEMQCNTALQKCNLRWQISTFPSLCATKTATMLTLFLTLVRKKDLFLIEIRQSFGCTYHSDFS